MNHNKNVVVFTLSTTFILLVYSLFAAVSGSNPLGLNNISILTDVFKERKALPAPSLPVADTVVPIAATSSAQDTSGGRHITGKRWMGIYTTPGIITSFATDTTKSGLPGLMQKLAALRKGKKSKVRIAWFGDSMIEGDLLTQTFRKRIQQLFGSYGAGFIAATSVTSAFRSTVNHKWTGDWKEENFKTKDLTAPLFLSGHTFYTAKGELMIKDATVKDSTQLLEKSLLCGPVAGNLNLTVNGKLKQYRADKKINRLLLDNSRSRDIDVIVQNDKLPVYGITMEPESGVIVDNFSFRGITGLELAKLDSSFLRSLESENGYDLVILEYGANLMFRPDDTDYSWFQKHIIPVVKKLQTAMPHTEFLIVSTADRAFRYGEEWKTATGIDNVIKMQATMAYTNEMAFYNLYASMGGNGTIVRWADSTTALANKDYIHPNFKGADILGNMLFDAFMRDLGKAKNN